MPCSDITILGFKISSLSKAFSLPCTAPPPAVDIPVQTLCWWGRHLVFHPVNSLPNFWKDPRAKHIYSTGLPSHRHSKCCPLLRADQEAPLYKGPCATLWGLTCPLGMDMALSFTKLYRCLARHIPFKNEQGKNRNISLSAVQFVIFCTVESYCPL